jgi:hypothetical protein
MGHACASRPKEIKMKVTLNIEYAAERDRPTETDADEQRALDAIAPLAEEFARIVRDGCAREGLDVTVG